MRAIAAILCFALAGCTSAATVAPAASRPPMLAKVLMAGRSMFPTLPEHGDVVAAFFYPFASLKAGDIVIYWSARLQARVIHRLREFRAGFGWTVQGDNVATNPVRDPEWVTPDNFCALVISAG
jgi:hypothetical protein